jgi:hypothetical protein
MKERSKNLSRWQAASVASGLLICVLAFAPLRSALIGQAPMQIAKFIDRVRPADLIVAFFAQPGKPLFEQRQHVLNKRP